MGSGFVPHTLLFANDVLLCAEDVLRLVLHDAHIACGMDFYTAPWQRQQQQQQQQQGEQSAGGSTSATTDANGSSNSGAGSDDKNIGSDDDDDDDDDDDFFDPERMQLLSSTGSSAGSKATAGQQQQQQHHGNGSLRFYDKWVARDAAGSRLVNRPPFIRHAASAAALAAGLPVAMSCCWNGLAVLSAAPFLQGLRFRAQQPGECRASECSLLCDDFARLGLAHVVMDPGAGRQCASS
ncbi:hypothetical protein OEZ86_010090 [Tetradesmus obliquus]|nr:hypothetical protein OEZ86_010090 [Tetradesmus obliquus]